MDELFKSKDYNGLMTYKRLYHPPYNIEESKGTELGHMIAVRA